VRISIEVGDEQDERGLIRAVMLGLLRRTQFSIPAVASFLGRDVTTIRRRCRRLGIDVGVERVKARSRKRRRTPVLPAQPRSPGAPSTGR